jgi:hypothetical protein
MNGSPYLNLCVVSRTKIEKNCENLPRHPSLTDNLEKFERNPKNID